MIYDGCVQLVCTSQQMCAEVYTRCECVRVDAVRKNKEGHTCRHDGKFSVAHPILCISCKCSWETCQVRRCLLGLNRLNI